MIASTVKATLDAMERREEKTDRWLTAEEVCERLDVTRCTLWRWNKEGYLEGKRFGRRIRYAESDVARIKQTEKKGGIK